VEEFGLDLFVTLLILCFALATLWLIPLFGWVVLAGLGWTCIELFLRLTEERHSYIFPGRTVRTLDVLTDNDVALFLLATAGAAYLTWLSVRALRGRLMSMLARDQG
jgi:threonine/homoserine/homoserine lactone efflux protein